MVSGRLTRLTLGLFGILYTGTASAQGGTPPPNNLPNDYITVLNWAKFPDGRRWGSTAGIDVAPDGTIWAYDRCGSNSCVDSDLDPILHFDTSGRLLIASVPACSMFLMVCTSTPMAMSGSRTTASPLPTATGSRCSNSARGAR